MPELHITVGIPGCGKSTFADEYGSQTGAIVVSSDKLREELTGNVEDQSRNRDLFGILHQRVSTILDEGYSVLVDATNLKPEYRKNLMAIALDLEVPAYAHWFEVSLDYSACQTRNLARERVVPERVMKRFHKAFCLDCTPATLGDEGWVVKVESA
jgi:predicted kinase